MQAVFTPHRLLPRSELISLAVASVLRLHDTLYVYIVTLGAETKLASEVTLSNGRN